MGFSSNLLSKAAHEALLNRQDAELRLLETMRRCMIKKAICDKENALALLSVASHGQKIERSEDLSGSLLAQAWKTMMVELENTAKLIKQNAETIETKSLEKLNTIFNDKRKARKQYQEDHNRLTSQFTRLTDDVARKKMEYQKNLETYKQSRARFEEHYIKSGRVGRKLDEVREKYQKACRKLHLTHNEYVLLLNEAAEYERDYRTLLLPGLLEHQQGVQESCVVFWQQLLQDISQNSNIGSEKFLQIHKRVDDSIEAIKPNEEYFDFTEKFKSMPLPLTEFNFDDSLVDDTSGKLQANQLMIDNLTIDWIRWKLSELEALLKDGPEKFLPVTTDTPNSHRKSFGETLPRPMSAEVSRKGVNEVLSQERKIQRQIEVIKAALSELGCEEIPSGCDLSLDHFETTTEGPQGDRVSEKTLHTQQRIVNILRKPFRRKSVPPSPCLGRGEFPSIAVGEANTCKAVVTDQKASSVCRPLVDEEWFHGVLPREEVVRLLTHEGDFLVRETTRNSESQIVLSVCWGGHKHFIVQITSEGQFRFEGLAFPTIAELIQHQWQSGLLVTGRSGAVLKKPIFRECWELNNDDVELLDKIGRGNFGDVYKAKLKPSNIDVAVKTCRLTLPEDHKKKFLQEGRILKQYNHPNIVKLIGICVQKQPIMIVMELVPGGSLVTYLRNRASVLDSKQLMGMCRDAAAGMSYLESKNCIHRDLAARNCLVSHDNTVKISDFGMSREEEEYIVSDGMKQIPIKWTAPEALNFGKYTTLCDVWSYGVLAWEIFAKGGIPYSNMSNTKARERIDEGYRMPPPEGIPQDMYQLLLRCWAYEPEKRPHFVEIYMIVETLLAAMRS